MQRMDHLMKGRGIYTAGSILPIRVFLVVSAVLVGLYFEFLSCAASVFLIYHLWYLARKRGRLKIPIGISFVALTVMVAFYGLSVLWAVDKGLAILGFVKYLPLPLFLLNVVQFEEDQRKILLTDMPWIGAGITAAAWVFSVIPSTASFVLVNGRLSGSFQYPNTFALYLLLGVLILTACGRWNWKRVLCMLLLLCGIVLSGSRTVLVLLLVAFLVQIVLEKNKKIRRIFILSAIVFVAFVVIYALVSGDRIAAGRGLTISLSSSTFLGRFLYYKDALPVILRHPFGLGYLGYYYLQGSFQTGVYSVMNVHNDFLQLLLDVGWIPAILILWAFIRSFLKGDRMKRMVLLFMAAHCMFDFDMQFPVIGFAAVLAMDVDSGKVSFCDCKWYCSLLFLLLGAVSVYFGIASGCYCFKQYEAAVRVYPAYTAAWQELLPESESVEELESIADRILKYSDSVSLAHTAKARCAYSRGDFEQVILHKEKAIALSRYTLAEYLDYFEMLYTGMLRYQEYGDNASVAVCREKLLTIPEMMDSVLADSSGLAWKIDEKPALELPVEYEQLLVGLREQ